MTTGVPVVQVEAGLPRLCVAVVRRVKRERKQRPSWKRAYRACCRKDVGEEKRKDVDYLGMPRLFHPTPSLC